MRADLNCVELAGILIERKPLRYTPAGVPVIECVVSHQSEQLEAGISRHVECEVSVIALGEAARWIQGAVLGTKLCLTGFLAARSKNSKQPRLHVTEIEFEEGKLDGQIHEKKG